jgi:hypothetical protein
VSVTAEVFTCRDGNTKTGRVKGSTLGAGSQRGPEAATQTGRRLSFRAHLWSAGVAAHHPEHREPLRPKWGCDRDTMGHAAGRLQLHRALNLGRFAKRWRRWSDAVGGIVAEGTRKIEELK